MTDVFNHDFILLYLVKSFSCYMDINRPDIVSKDIHIKQNRERYIFRSNIRVI